VLRAPRWIEWKAQVEIGRHRPILSGLTRNGYGSPAATKATRATHPLEPLTADEITRAWEILRTRQALDGRIRVISITLHEPPKEVVVRDRPGEAGERAAFVVLIDSAAARAYEAVVSVSQERVLSSAQAWLPDQRPPALVRSECVPAT
jgi:primary-amine oxidase